MYLLGLLNSKLFSCLFRLRFQAKRLAGQYLAVNLGQLSRLPVVVPPRRIEQQLARWVTRRLAVEREQGSSAKLPPVARLEQQIDHAIYELYDLPAAEIDQIERMAELTTEARR
jgi:hypothetical protein